MSWMKKATSVFAVILAFGMAEKSYADFSNSALTRKFASIKSADHSVVFTRLRDGKVLFENNPDMTLSPASVTKVLTSAASLNYFGPAFAFKTPILYTGKFDRHKIQGDLVIKGNGDPFIVSEVLWQTAIDLHHLGLREVQGGLIIDNSLFDEETRDESRLNSTQKSTHAYDAPVSAFAVNFNTVAVAFAPTFPGKLANTEVTPFPLRHVKLLARTKTTSGSDDSAVSLSRNALANGGVALTTSGSIGVNASIKKLYRSAGNPDVTAGDYLVGFLEKAGIHISGKVRTGGVSDAAKPLYEITGFEMRKIVQGLNTFSNNFIADMLTKRLGAAVGQGGAVDAPGSGSLSTGVRVLSDFLRGEVGIKTEFKILNGSGLSTENRMSARHLVSILNYMETRGELYPDFLASLPASGWDGTLKKRMRRADALAGQIHAKSGTLTEPITVAALAGYFRHPKEGWVSFAMISNGREGKPQPGLQDVRNLQDDVLKGIFEE